MMTRSATEPGTDRDVLPVPTKGPPWHGYVSADFFLSGLSAGMFMLAGFGYLIGPGIYGGASRIGYLAAFPLILVDLACLVADLGDPTRFHHMLRVFKLRSPMSTGTWALSVYALVGFVAFILALLGFSILTEWRAIIGAIGILPAVYVTAYKGVMLSNTAQPGWKDARWLGGEFALSSGAMGAAGLLLISLALTDPNATAGYRLALIMFLATGLFFKLLLASHFFGRVELRHYVPAVTYAFILAIGTLAPLARSLATSSEPALLAAAILTVTGELGFRHYIIELPRQLGDRSEPHSHAISSSEKLYRPSL